MSGAWGFARDFESSILVGALARERRSTTGADEGALADDAQVCPPPPGGDLRCYWMRKHGLGASGLQATPIFFRAGAKDVRPVFLTYESFDLVFLDVPRFLNHHVLKPYY
jgi:hypothetical protein